MAMPHIERLYALSDCRTPLICCVEHGDPLAAVEELAKAMGSTLWPVTPHDPKSDQNALDYLDVGLTNGDWLYLQSFDSASPAVMRDIGRELYTIMPEPERCPRREVFRLWLVVDKWFDLDTDERFPRVLTQHALFGWTNSEGLACIQTRTRADPRLLLEQLVAASPKKVVKTLEEDADIINDPSRKVIGPLFHRSADLFTPAGHDVTLNTAASIFDHIERGDVMAVAAMCADLGADLNGMAKGGLSPLFWAIMCDSIAVVRLLLENAADPNEPRPGTGQPPTFMALEDPEMLQLLLDFGADLNAEFEGRTLVDHPDTHPAIAAYARRLQP